MRRHRMKYFELFQSPKVENPIAVTGLDKDVYCYAMRQKDFEALDKMKVAYYSGSESEEPCDILTDPTFMISDKLKRLIAMYDKEIVFKGVQVFSTSKEREDYPLYWVPQFPEINALHSSSIINDNGSIATLILDNRMIGNMHVFRLSDCLEYKVVVSMTVAESILRRRLYGIGLKKLEVA